MPQTGQSNAIVNLMLGWLKGLASWVLRLFNLSGGFSPLKFLADNWLKLLILLLIVGIAADLIIWLVRWRPHWVWFHKKRVIINDSNFFAGEDAPEAEEDDVDWDLPEEFLPKEREDRTKRNWRDNDYVVAGASRRRREEARRIRLAEAQRKQELAGQEASASVAADVFTDGDFNIDAKQRGSDRYEDEVFSVKDLPQPERPKGKARDRERGSFQRSERRSGRGRASGARR